MVQLTLLKSQVLQKLDRYSKPVKTKHLATRLDMDRTDLAEILNTLAKKKRVVFVEGYDRFENYVCGWISTRQINTNITYPFLPQPNLITNQVRSKKDVQN